MVVVLVVSVLVVSRSGHSPTTPAGTGSTAPTAPTTSPTTRSAGPYAVGTQTLDLSEPVPGGASRSLPTVVRYPARGTAGSTVPGAVPDRTDGPYPLLVFSQGYQVAAESYAALLTHWAESGYVVVDPTYPLTDPSGPTNESDIANHPTDLRFVISSVLQAGGLTVSASPCTASRGTPPEA